MAKKNETAQKKVSKWEAAPKSIKDLYFAIGGVFDGLSSIIDPEEADNEDKALIELLARVLDDYNELEAKHQKECGMISEYEEELSVRKEENKQIKADLENQVAITEKLRELRDELNKILEHSNCGYGLNKPESLESLKKFLKDEYKFDVTFIRTSPDEGFWKLVQRGPNVFNRKSNNFRWAFRGAMECLGMSPGAIAAEIIWTSNSKVTPTDISAKWSQRACEIYEKGGKK